MTEEKGIQLSPTQKLSLDYKLYELTKFVDRDDYWWKEFGQRATPFKYIPELESKLDHITKIIEDKISNKTTYQLQFTPKLQITKVPMTPSGVGSQWFVNPKCYALTLHWAIWNVLEYLVNESITSTVSVEEYLALIDGAILSMSLVEVSDKVKLKENEESVDNIE